MAGDKEMSIEVHNKTDRDLLVEAIAAINILTSSFEKYSSGEGFARCQLHNERIAQLGGTMRWIKRALIGVVVALVLNVFQGWFI
jgi:hypothetical protein